MTAAVPLSATRDSLLRRLAQVNISLLTCGPGEEIWSLYGHTAIRIQDPEGNSDYAVNYGMFSFGQKYFIPKFVFGLTDYQMGIEPTAVFVSEYEEEGRWVKAQLLNLTPEEKGRIIQAIEENYLPENRTYRYNYFYDNCTTRAKAMLLSHRNPTDSLIQRGITRKYPSYRALTHTWNEDHRWARFGNDLLLGIGADRPTDFKQQEFLPMNLSKDFDHTFLIRKGKKIPLVTKSVYLVSPSAQMVNGKGFTPLIGFLIFGLLLCILFAIEIRRKANYWGIDLFLMLITGIPGLLLFLMIFSEHPTVSLNLQILILNPLNLVFVYPLVKKERAGQLHPWWKTETGFLILGILGGFFQHYAEGILILACVLLFRCILKLTLSHDIEKSKA